MDFISGIDAWLLWGLAAIALFILELFTPGFVLACFGIGAGFAVFPALVGLGFTWQLIFFAIGSLLSIFFIRPRLLSRPKVETYPIGLEALKGREIRISEDIPEGEYIEVPIDGDVWRVKMKEGTAKRGDLIRICGRSGLTLFAMISENNMRS